MGWVVEQCVDLSNGSRQLPISTKALEVRRPIRFRCAVEKARNLETKLIVHGGNQNSPQPHSADYLVIQMTQKVNGHAAKPRSGIGNLCSLPSQRCLDIGRLTAACPPRIPR